MTKKAKRVPGKSIGKRATAANKTAGKAVASKTREVPSPPSDAALVGPNEPARPTRNNRDARLPPVGTTLVKRDRTGAPRCECTIEADGYRYKSTVHRSLTAAARAAATDLGVSPAVNGLVFWGVVRPNTGGLKPAERLRKAAARYRAQAEAASREGATDAEREEIRRELQTHAAQLGKLITDLAA